MLASRPEAHDRGQAAILVVVVSAVLLVVLMAALVTFGRATLDRTRAQSVADSAALASLGSGRAGAVEIAVRHGATLVAWAPGPGPDTVTVTVRFGGATATARATDAP